MIDETAIKRVTRAEQRAATHAAIVDAAVACLVEEGYASLTTRRVAERAAIAQSTVMHHFPARGGLIVEAVTALAQQLTERSQARIDVDGLRVPELRSAVLDEAWKEFTSPQALAAAQIWIAAWSEPELAVTLRELEERISLLIVETAMQLFPEAAGDPRLLALLDASVSLIRGLVMGLPIWGREVVDARWAAIKPIILDSAAEIFDA